MERYESARKEVALVDGLISETQTLLKQCEARVQKCEQRVVRFQRYDEDVTLDAEVTGACVVKAKFRLEQELALWAELDERLTELQSSFAHNADMLAQMELDH